MKVWRLVVREIAHRKMNFALGLLSVAVAVACLTGALTLLEAHERRTEEILSEKQQEVEQKIAQSEKEVEKSGKAFEDVTRKIMKGLGFNIYIFPEDQDLMELDLEGQLSKTMPEDFANRLAESGVVTVNHLLPQVIKKVEWTEMPQLERPITLVGTRDEVPIMHRNSTKPVEQNVPPAEIVLGYQLHQRLELSVGTQVKLLGKEFTVSRLHEERGTADDSTVWINLADAQEILGLQNLVHVIKALECNCAAADRIGQIREEISGILPGTQVRELGPQALARAEQRNRAKQAAVAALERQKRDGAELLERERESRKTLRSQREGFAAVLVPLVIVGAAVWIGFLAFTNVRQRSAEIGILRAIGVRSPQILFIFLGKALLIGLIGAAAGYLAGVGVGVAWGTAAGELTSVSRQTADFFAPGLLLMSLVLALLLSALASWIPAMLAAQQDPAIVLQNE